MRGAVIYAPGDIRLEDRADPTIEHPTDAVIRMSATCVCGSDLWDYRGINPVEQPTPMGHEYVGIVEEVGSEVTSIKPGQFVIGSFFASDNTCEICQAGYQTNCIHREFVGANGAQAQYLRVPLADGTLVATPEVPDADLVPSLLTASDVLGTGWFGAVAADVQPGNTVAVVGDGAVGLLGVLAAKQLGAERIIAFSHHEQRQKLAREFGDPAATSASPTTSPCPAKNCSTATSTCTAGPHRYAASCPTSPTASGSARSTQARSSTSPCRSTKSPRATRRWTNAAQSRHCYSPEPSATEQAPAAPAAGMEHAGGRGRDRPTQHLDVPHKDPPTAG
jgi:threonine dehydrogenase-like Zn-dependent dehydrogenase